MTSSPTTIGSPLTQEPPAPAPLTPLVADFYGFERELTERSLRRQQTQKIEAQHGRWQHQRQRHNRLY